MKNLRQLVEGKSAVYIPIYSMFDHQTHLVNLECDGNVNRWMTNFYKLDNCWKSLEVFGPRESISTNFDLFTKKLSKFEKFSYIQSPLIANHAGTQRSDDFARAFVTQNQDKLLNADVIVVEGQGLVNELINLKKAGVTKAELVYWCPVCETNHKSRSFLKKDKESNEKIFKQVDCVIVVAKDQIEYLKECDLDDDKIIFAEEFIDRSLGIFDYKKDDRILDAIALDHRVIYMPFRLSDEGYKIWEIVKTLQNFSNIRVLTPNLNGATDAELVKICLANDPTLSEEDVTSFISRLEYVPSARDTYYTMIDYGSNVIIPYFEDIDFVMHAAVDELIRNKTPRACIVCQTREDLIEELNK